MPDFLRASTPVARKRHWCDSCAEPIEQGTKHNAVAYVDDGAAYTWREHPECTKMHQEARKYFDIDPHEGSGPDLLQEWLLDVPEAQAQQYGGERGVQLWQALAGARERIKQRWGGL